MKEKQTSFVLVLQTIEFTILVGLSILSTLACQFHTVKNSIKYKEKKIVYGKKLYNSVKEN